MAYEADYAAHTLASAYDGALAHAAGRRTGPHLLDQGIRAKMGDRFAVNAASLNGEPALLRSKENPVEAERQIGAARGIVAATSANGGATADMYSMKTMGEGDPGFVVGATPDARTGKSFPSHLVDAGAQGTPEVTVHDVFSAREKMLPAALAANGGKGDPNAAFGTWTNTAENHPEGHHVALDYSQTFATEHEAGRRMMKRKEEAIWDNGGGREVSNAEYRKANGYRVRPKRDTDKPAGQNVVMRRAES